MLTYDLPRFAVHGSPAELGEQQGRQLGPAVQRFVNQRLRAAKVYLWEHGSRDVPGFLHLGAQCYELFCDWDPAAAMEHDALAMAAGVSPQELYTTTNMTDIRDILLVQLQRAGSANPALTASDNEGCTSVLVSRQRSANGQLWAAQTWDLNPQDVDDVVAIHRRPSEGPATWSVTCNGCPTLVGMNEWGLAVGTTNIKTDDARIGVGYLSVLHRAIRCQTVAEASKVISKAPRAAAHTYWVASPREARLLTTSATEVISERLRPQMILGQTNHLRHSVEGVASLEPASSSTTTRLSTVENWAKGTKAVDRASLQQLFSERQSGCDSVNRYPEDGTGSATDACFIAHPASKQAWACRGPADRGLWYALDPATGSAEPVTDASGQPSSGA